MPLFDTFDRYMFQRMDDFFRDGFTEEPLSLACNNNRSKSLATIPSSHRGMLLPKLDVVEKANEFLVSFELPGVKKDDIKVSIEDGVLSVMAERREEKKDDNENDHYHYSERRYGSIKRAITLPPQADAENVNASFENGVLSLGFAKKPDSTARKQITIS